MDNKMIRYGTEETPFSPATASESLLFVSGQGGCDLHTGEVKVDDLEHQTLHTLRNIQTILSQSGLTLHDVVKINVYLSDRKHYEEFNRIYSRLFPRPYPARTLVYCQLNFDLLVEIDVIASLRNQK